MEASLLRNRWKKGRWNVDGIPAGPASISRVFRHAKLSARPARQIRQRRFRAKHAPLTGGSHSSLDERLIFLPAGYRRRARRGELKIAAARVGILERSRRRRPRRPRRPLRLRRRRLSGDPY